MSQPVIVERAPIIDVDTPGVAVVLRLRVPARRRVPTQVAAARPSCLRLVVGGVPVLWARIEGYWDHSWFVRGSVLAPHIIPAIDAATVRRFADVDDADRLDKWSRFFIGHLTEATTMLHEGTWFMSAATPVQPHLAWAHPFASNDGCAMVPPLVARPAASTWQTSWSEQWCFGDDDDRVPQGDLLPLRRITSADHGRLKWWRKKARAQTLPPVFAWFVPLLQKYVVLDGHLRWRAALDEGVTPTVLALWHARDVVVVDDAARVVEAAADLQRRGIGTVADLNQIVLRAHGVPSSPRPMLHAWPLAATAWRDEVTAQLHHWSAAPGFVDEMLP